MIGGLVAVRLNESWRTRIKATLVAFVPSPERQRMAVGNTKLDKISTDAIVKLESFDKGKFYQIPLELVEEWEEWMDNPS